VPILTCQIEKERLPVALGWKRATVPFTLEGLQDGIGAIINVTDATPAQARKMRARRGFHAPGILEA